MDAETAPKPARPRLNPYTKALRRERIFSRLRLGWPTAEIAREERLSERRVRKIVSDALRRQTVDDASDHALLQLVRLEGAQALAAEAIDAGDLKAIAPYLKVLDGLDRYHKAGAAKPVYDDAARERLFAKMSRIADRTGGQGSQGAWAGRPRPDRRRRRAVIRGGRGERPQFWCKSLKNKDNEFVFRSAGFGICSARLGFRSE